MTQIIRKKKKKKNNTTKVEKPQIIQGNWYFIWTRWDWTSNFQLKPDLFLIHWLPLGTSLIFLILENSQWMVLSTTSSHWIIIKIYLFNLVRVILDHLKKNFTQMTLHSKFPYLLAIRVSNWSVLSHRCTSFFSSLFRFIM